VRAARHGKPRARTGAGASLRQPCAAQAWLALLFFLASARAGAQAPAASSTQWQHRLTPYLWLAGLHGTLGAHGITGEADISFSEVLKNLDLGLMLSYEGRRGRTVALADTLYLRTSGDADTPGALFSGAEVTSRQFMIDLEAGSVLMENAQGSWAVLAGVRYWNMRNNLDLHAGTLPAQEVGETNDWFDPVIGLLARRNLSPKWSASLKADIGGFGVGSDFTWQLSLNISSKSALVLGYRYLDVDYASGGFTCDVALQGPLLGYQFRF
jgi:hypothetical protein